MIQTIDSAHHPMFEIKICNLRFWKMIGLFFKKDKEGNSFVIVSVQKFEISFPYRVQLK
jgi:hypothetical protein